MKELYRQFIGVSAFKEQTGTGPVYYPPFRARCRIQQNDVFEIDGTTASIIRLTTFDVYVDPLNRIPEVWDEVIEQHGGWQSSFLINNTWSDDWLTDEYDNPYDPAEDHFTQSELDSTFSEGSWNQIGLVEPNYDLEGFLQFVKLVRD